MLRVLGSPTKLCDGLTRRESQATRDLYGMSLFGQACLAGRRMLDAGTKLVSVFWDEYGLAGDTLVVCLSEHGRTPKLNNREGGGRDHWSRAYSAVFAGASIRRGNVVGATDGHAADVVERPISPKDVLATMYHLLGFDPHTTIPDRAGRPVPLVPEGNQVVPELLV